MADSLLARIRRRLGAEVVEKQIVGGTGFTWQGNLMCGVMAGDLLVRVAKSDHPAFVSEPGAAPMTMGGRSSKGWIVVQAASVDSEAALATWLERARAFAATLPAK